MDHVPSQTAEAGAILFESLPVRQTAPLVFASPHSGREYDPAFVAASRLDSAALRRSEDSFVDELFAAAPAHGAPLLAALFPRAFCDPNREPYELDPTMFDGPLPHHANIRSPRVAAGLGTIAKVVASGSEIYAGRLPAAEIERRVENFYRPYHAALRNLVDATLARFGRCALIDCHSMPSVGGPMDRDSGLARVDIVLGDCFGASCSAELTQAAEDAFKAEGLRVVRNTPYAGGFTTRHYGQPRAGVHALQIEINRALYMIEATHERSQGFARLAEAIERVIDRLAAFAANGETP